MTEEEKLNRASSILDLIERSRERRKTISSNIIMLGRCLPDLRTKFVHQLIINNAAFKRLKKAYDKQMKELKEYETAI